jgi:hypothetical protein
MRDIGAAFRECGGGYPKTTTLATGIQDREAEFDIMDILAFKQALP